MSELQKTDFLNRLRNRENYLYRVGVLATPNERYLQYAYEYILQNETEYVDGKCKLKNVNAVTRDRTYHYEHAQTNKTRSNREEEWFVMDMFKESQAWKAIFGRLVDYQIPLKNKRSDKGVGKIDFLYEKEDGLYFAEIKAKDSKESILKAIIEVQTYFQIADQGKLLKDYCLPPETAVKKSVVIFKDTKAYNQLSDKRMQELLKLFEINLVVLDSEKKYQQVN